MIAIIYWSVRTELIQFASVIYHCCSPKKSPTKRFGLAEQKFAPRPQITDNGRANKLSGAQPPTTQSAAIGAWWWHTKNEWTRPWKYYNNNIIRFFSAAIFALSPLLSTSSSSIIMILLSASNSLPGLSIWKDLWQCNFSGCVCVSAEKEKSLRT